MNEFERLLDRWRRKEPGAFDELVVRYLPLVRAVVRQRLSDRLRTRFDSHDFTQDVWASLFQVSLSRLELPTEEDLIAFLARLAEAKVARQGRHQHRKKADIRRELSLTNTPEPVGGGHTPSLEVMAQDRWAEITAGLTDAEREMVRMIRDGHSYDAVAVRFDLTTRTVRRLVERLRLRPSTGDQ